MPRGWYNQNIRTKILPSKPKEEIIKITERQSIKNVRSLFPNRWPLKYMYPPQFHIVCTHKEERRHRNLHQLEATLQEPQKKYRIKTVTKYLLWCFYQISGYHFSTMNLLRIGKHERISLLENYENDSTSREYWNNGSCEC